MAHPISRTVPLLLVVLMTAAAAAATGQEARYRAPRTDSGQPDLHGVWNFNSGTPLQRAAALPDKKFFTREEAAAQRGRVRTAFASIAKLAPVEAVGFDWFDGTPLVEDLRTSLITYPENGRLPALVKGVTRTPGVEDFIALLGDAKGGPPPALGALLAAFGGGKKDSYTDFSMFERCVIGADVPFVPQPDDNYVQIIQSRDHVALVMDFERRVISLTSSWGPPSGGPPSDAPRSWAGTSKGRWEGETLVVETRNFDGRARSFAGAGYSRDKIVTERFTRTANNTIEYSATVVDPKTFQDRVEVSFPMGRADAQIYEGACHEGNYSLSNALSAARSDEAKKSR
jgi:hypothetical protein